MKLILKETLTINESGTSIQEKYPELVGQPKTFTLNMDDIYYVTIGYNQITNNLFLVVKKENDIIQGITDILSFPRNLLLLKEFNNYALFYKNGVFYFCKLDKDDKKFNAEIDLDLLKSFDNEILRA